jgi:4-hydroxybenzoyl-CoA thioesterase
VIYHRSIPIEFNHCDPAGIVFYPRYFEMTNSVVENFFREIVGVSYSAMMAAREGVPTANLKVDFHAPSRLGEVLDWQMTVEKVGRSSVSLVLRAHGDTLRVSAALTLVRVGPDGRPKPWSDAMRLAFAPYQENTDA